MPDNSQEGPAQGTTPAITVGKVIAGTAMVAGAVLLAVTVFPSLLNSSATDPTKTSVLQKLMNGITSLFGDTNKITGEFSLSSRGALLAGAGLAGGGYALHSAMKGKEEDLREAQTDQMIQNARGDKWRAKIENGAIRGQMMGRMAMADPAYFSQTHQVGG